MTDRELQLKAARLRKLTLEVIVGSKHTGGDSGRGVWKLFRVGSASSRSERFFMKPNLVRCALCICTAAFVLIFLSGCTGVNYLYAPKEQMIVLQSHNHFLEVGPCGGPWNYDDQINILLPDNRYQCDASQLVAYQSGRLKIDSGYVILDRTNKTVTIELTFEGYENAGRVPVKCKYNGVHKYVEHELQANEVTRQWLQDFHRTNGTAFYAP